MREITISAEVFSRIWALRAEGEDTENDILARLLAEGSSRKQENYRESKNTADGVRDTRHGVHFPEGFEIFRAFKGQNIQAVASGGKWLWSGAAYGSLNELSRAIGAGAENAWANWFFLGPDGRRKAVSSLRDPTAVTRRVKKPKPAKKAPTAKPPQQQASREITWLDDVQAGLAAIEDRRGFLDDIYKAVEKIRRDAGRPWPDSAPASIRQALEENAALFDLPYGKGAGFWALK